ncbi:hypothetical protein WJX74_009949 [Apatococcus lobatus]|uniref:Sulfhydryl oxidase n=1 Tax=Apatococcus lobatus TaxID=904363 RepID=A0AAW1SG99_9CHLO
MPKVAIYAAATEPALTSPATYSPKYQVPAGPITKDDLGRATWTLLHTLAAQYPDTPTRRQQKDVKALVDLLTRIYPCSDCAKHFRELVRKKPPQVASGEELQQWMCMAHNDVNQSIGKPAFNCKMANARWGTLDCGSELACSMDGGH